jgi:hypothetical protein
MVRKMNFEIVVRQVENGVIINESLIKEIKVNKPKNIQEVGFRHEEQVRIIQNIQDAYLPLQCKLLFDLEDICPTCGNKIRKTAYTSYLFIVP